MITVEEFKSSCVKGDFNAIVDDILLADYAKHVSARNRQVLSTSICSKFGIEESSIQLWIVGSAKLGFSISEKTKDGITLPRYRPFSPESDIDVAVVSSKLFALIWDELSIYAHGCGWMPWNSGKLGDYFVYGWLRPDYFPHNIRRCDDWWGLFHAFSKDPRFGRRRVRGALFYSIADLKRYQGRSAQDCILIEQTI